VQAEIKKKKEIFSQVLRGALSVNQGFFQVFFVYSKIYYTNLKFYTHNKSHFDYRKNFFFFFLIQNGGGTAFPARHLFKTAHTVARSLLI